MIGLWLKPMNFFTFAVKAHKSSEFTFYVKVTKFSMSTRAALGSMLLVKFLCLAEPT